MPAGKRRRRHPNVESTKALPDAHLADLTRLVTAQKGLEAALNNVDGEAYDHAFKSWKGNQQKLIDAADALAQRPEPKTTHKIELNDSQRLACRNLYNIVKELRLGSTANDGGELALKDAAARMITTMVGSVEGPSEVPVWIPSKYHIVDPLHPDYSSEFSLPEEEFLLADSDIPLTTSMGGQRD
ncbi:hypothetical protein FGG08_001455 [Glutinoglossum americanum]|uniref:Uncharacterized protein n=1 Tax=Glutinoglossum americanum TaxID=1670608 RepID=A0A9P8IBJ3_9PEZI|nr:hypothetical protein FGG08_001455 [Glutinoglossum americanum]